MENPFELILDKLNTIENLLRQVINNDKGSVTIVNVAEILNISQVAEYLSLAKSSIYKMTSERNIPHFKTGKKLLFKRSELDDWIKLHRIKTRQEIEKEADEYLMRKGSRRKLRN